MSPMKISCLLVKAALILNNLVCCVYYNVLLVSAELNISLGVEKYSVKPSMLYNLVADASLRGNGFDDALGYPVSYEFVQV